jgi:hypothetical protein
VLRVISNYCLPNQSHPNIMAAAFEELGVSPELIKAVEELGWA